MSMDHARARLLALAEGRGVSLTRLSGLIGKNPAYLQQFIRKGSPRKLEENDRAVLARFFGVDEGELAGAQDKSSAPRSVWIDIPRLRARASAGPGTLAEDEDVVGSFRFSDRWLRDQGLRPNNLTAITVWGDSMDPVLRDGDEILVDQSDRSLRGGIYVVQVDGVLLVKRLEARRAGHITLLSENPAYSPIECRAEEVDVIGRVVWKCGRL